MFVLDSQLAADTVEVTRLGLSRVLLMNDSTWPWLILVPERPGVRELTDLSHSDRHALLDEIVATETVLSTLFEPDKLNVGALGNMVAQLHVHVVARHRADPAWPRPVWGALPRAPYAEGALAERVAALRAAFAAPASAGDAAASPGDAPPSVEALVRGAPGSVASPRKELAYLLDADRRSPLPRKARIRVGTLAEGLVGADPDNAARHLDLAERSFAAALAEAPHNAVAAAGLARVHDRRGRTGEALAVLAPFLARDPVQPGIALAFAQIAPAAGRIDEAVAALRRALAIDSDLTRVTQGYFALGRLLDRAGAYDDAFAAYARGNAMSGEQMSAGARSFPDIVERIIAAVPAARWHTLPDSGNRSDLPVFVVGMGRSGTTLVEQILSAHPAIHGAGERRAVVRAVDRLSRPSGRRFPDAMVDWRADDFVVQADRFIAELRALAPGAARIVDKLPQNFVMLAAIDRLLPGARIVHCRRDPRDTCLSNWFQVQKVPIQETWDLHALGLVYRSYERLMEHWRETIRLPILDVVYEELVADPEAQIRRMVDFLGLPWDDRCLAFHDTGRLVDTSNYAEVRKPIHEGAVGRWRNYEAHLGPLWAGLAGTPRPAR